MRPALFLLFAASLFLSACSADDGRVAVAQEAHAPEEADVELRRVYVGTHLDFYASEPSPDGRYLSEIDWDTGDLSVLDLVTGKQERISDKGSWVNSADYAEHSVFSPDGARMAYAWFSESNDGYEIREIGVDGSKMRVLVEAHPDLTYMSPEDWSPDGETILATVFRSDRSSAMATISTDDGALRTLKTSDWRHPFVSTFSPDAQWIAYDFQPDEDAHQRDVFIMASDGSRDARVVDGPSNDILLGWLPTGGAILFYSDRDHTRAIWMQRIRDGRAVGDPELVKADVWQLFPLGFSDDAYYFGVTVESPQVHTATIDLDSRRTVVPPAAVVEPSAGRTRSGTWSPDGRYFAYLQQRPGDRTHRLVLRSAMGEETREIPLDRQRARALQWHPDGRSLTMLGTDRKGREGIHRVDIRSGQQTVFLERTHFSYYRLAPDGRTVFTKQPRSGEEAGGGIARILDILAIDAESGEERTLYSLISPGGVDFSPDGTHFTTRDVDVEAGTRSVKIGRTDGSGELRTILESEVPIPQGLPGFPWTPDGRHVLVPQVLDCDATPELCEQGNSGARVLMVPVDGGEPTVLMDGLDGPLNNLSLSPDGRKVAFESGSFRGEIWRMENLPSADRETATRTGSR